MKNFIIDLIEILKDNSSDISEIKTYKKGVLPPLPAFPALSILPQSETFSYQYSGGKYRVAKEVELQLYLKGLSLKVIKESLRSLIKRITRILTDNYTLSGTLYDLYLESQGFQDPLVLTNSIIQSATIRIIGYSFEFKPTNIASDESLKHLDENKVISEIKELFIRYKNSIEYPLSTIKSLNLQTIGPQSNFPAVLIAGSLDSPRVRTFTGLDTLELRCEISIFTKLLDKNYALYSNLDLVENIKRVLQLSGNLNGYLLNPEILRINYFRTLNPMLGLVYSSVLEYGGQGIESLTNSF